MKIDEAKKVLLENVDIVDNENIDIKNSYGRVLSEDLCSNMNIPSFNRSPLDGYCFNSESTKGAGESNKIEFDVIDEVPCGYVSNKIITGKQTIKILTGSKLPQNANCVIGYEDVEIIGNKIILSRELSNNENVILAGEDIKINDEIIKKGNIIDIGVIGMIASLGINHINAYKKLKVGILSTGSELVEVYDKMEDGKIFNSNRFIFESIMNKLGCDVHYYGIVKDEIDSLVEYYDKAINENDVVISTGGVSVGDYDLIPETLAKLNCNMFVNRIEMKPGMACCFAKKNKTNIFALSGNPMSSLTTFYVVCLPAMRKKMGIIDYDNKFFKVKLKNSLKKKNHTDRFCRANVYIEDGEAVAVLDNKQGNIVISSLINRNAIVHIHQSESATENSIASAMFI